MHLLLYMERDIQRTYGTSLKPLMVALFIQLFVHICIECFTYLHFAENILLRGWGAFTRPLRFWRTAYYMGQLGISAELGTIDLLVSVTYSKKCTHQDILVTCFIINMCRAPSQSILFLFMLIHSFESCRNHIMVL